MLLVLLEICSQCENYLINVLSVGLIEAASPSGWIERKAFCIYLEHLDKITHCLTRNRILLICDRQAADTVQLQCESTTKQGKILSLEYNNVFRTGEDILRI